MSNLSLTNQSTYNYIQIPLWGPTGCVPIMGVECSEGLCMDYRCFLVYIGLPIVLNWSSSCEGEFLFFIFTDMHLRYSASHL